MRHGAAAEVGGGRLRLLEGVVHRFETDPAAVALAGEAGAVADRIDVGVAGLAVLVHGDAVVAGDAGVGRELDVRQDADADDHDVRRVQPVVGAANRAHVVHALERGDLPAQQHLDAMGAVFRRVERAHFRRHDAAHHALRDFEHGDGHPEPGEARRALEADVAGPDDHRAAAGAEVAADRLDVRQRAQRVDAIEVGARDVDPPGAGPGGQQQLAVVKAAAVVELHGARRRVEAHRAAAGQALDAVLRIERGGPDPQAPLVHLAGQALLRQRGPLVRQARLVAHQDDRSCVALPAQAVHGLRCGMAGAHDDEGVVHCVAPERPACAGPVEGSRCRRSCPSGRPPGRTSEARHRPGVRQDGASPGHLFAQVPDFKSRCRAA